MMVPTGIALLGATGSIGETAQRVVARHPERFHFVALTANGNRDGLRAAADRWAPGFVGLVEPGTEALPAGPVASPSVAATSTRHTSPRVVALAGRVALVLAPLGTPSRNHA